MKIPIVASGERVVTKTETPIAFNRFRPELRVTSYSHTMMGSKSLSRFDEVLASQVKSQKQMQSFSLTSTVLRTLSDSKLSLVRGIKGNS